MGAKGVKRPDLPCERSPPGGSSSLRSTAAEATLETTGAIAGGPDSFFCLTCTLNSGGKAIHHLPGAHLEAPEG